MFGAYAANGKHGKTPFFPFFSKRDKKGSMEHHPSPIQTFTVGFGVSPNPPHTAGHGLRLIAITAGREFHPAPKDAWNVYNCDLNEKYT
jgi:hypothetical protein